MGNWAYITSWIDNIVLNEHYRMLQSARCARVSCLPSWRPSRRCKPGTSKEETHFGYRQWGGIHQVKTVIIRTLLLHPPSPSPPSPEESCKVLWRILPFVHSHISETTLLKIQQIFMRAACGHGLEMALWYVMYFQFCGWHHVFTRWAAWYIMHIYKWREHNSYNIDSKQILLNDKDQQLHIMGCTLGAKSVIYNCLICFSNIILDLPAQTIQAQCILWKLYH